MDLSRDPYPVPGLAVGGARKGRVRGPKYHDLPAAGAHLRTAQGGTAPAAAGSADGLRPVLAVCPAGSGVRRRLGSPRNLPADRDRAAPPSRHLAARIAPRRDGGAVLARVGVVAARRLHPADPARTRAIVTGIFPRGSR